MSLPDAPSSLSLSNTRQDTITFGFGVSMGAKAYKVIRIYKTSTIEIEVFTLGTDHWRTLERQDHCNELVIPNYMKAGLCFNGHVHWIDARRGRLFVFELDNETFNSFPSPPPVYEEKIIIGCLGVLKVCSKKWHDLVLDPYFVNNMWPKNPNNLSLMIHDSTLSPRDRGVINWVEIEEKEEDFDVARILTLDLSTPRELKRFRKYSGCYNVGILVGGSVDGLICARSVFQTTYIMNPVTKEYMSLPDAPSSLSSLSYSTCPCWIMVVG
ncbi:F-box associated domain containing protein [Tanacetum coccineum]